jgi:hypothetical protein
MSFTGEFLRSEEEHNQRRMIAAIALVRTSEDAVREAQSVAA